MVTIPFKIITYVFFLRARSPNKVNITGHFFSLGTVLELGENIGISFFPGVFFLESGNYYRNQFYFSERHFRCWYCFTIYIFQTVCVNQVIFTGTGLISQSASSDVGHFLPITSFFFQTVFSNQVIITGTGFIYQSANSDVGHFSPITSFSDSLFESGNCYWSRPPPPRAGATGAAGKVQRARQAHQENRWQIVGAMAAEVGADCACFFGESKPLRGGSHWAQ